MCISEIRIVKWFTNSDTTLQNRFIYNDLDHLASMFLKLLQMIQIIWNGQPVAKGTVHLRFFANGPDHLDGLACCIECGL